MARGKRKSRRKRTTRRSTRALGKINRMPSMPPSLDLQSNIFTCWIRQEVGVSQPEAKFWVNEWTFTEMMTPTYQHLTQIFAEYRLKRVNVWYIPAITITATGIHSLAVYDDGDDYFISPSITDVCSAPGSHTAKVFQPLKSCWHRSEPKDKNWMPTNTDNRPFSTAIATSEKGLSGVLILDYHLSFRGLKSSTKIRKSDLKNDCAAVGSFENLDMSSE